MDGLTDDERAAYSQASDGRLHLHPELAALIDECEAELAEERAQSARLSAKLKGLAGRSAYRRELEAAGIDRRLTEAAVALLLERAPVDDDGYCQTEHGLLPVSHVVSSVLASEAGEASAPKKATTGQFSAEIARLRALH